MVAASLLFAALMLLVSCSTTSNLPEGDVLYTGIKKTRVHDQKNTYAESVALTEVEGALAYAPNNSFMGSSSIRIPPPIGLWIHNSMINKEHGKLGKWFLNAFGSTPVTIAMVSPMARTKVASNTLQNYGYFGGWVDYELVDAGSRKQKINYDIHLGEPSMLDSVKYFFRGTQDSIVQANFDDRYLKSGDQFSVPNLQAEQERISEDFRNNGYYYYRSDYVRYFADSTQVPKKVQLLVVPDPDVPDRANRQFYIGNIHTYIRKSPTSAKSSKKQEAPADSASADSTRREQRRPHMIAYDDSVVLGGLKYAWQGEKMPVKPKVLFKNYAFRREELFNQGKMTRTMTNLSNMQVFQHLQFTYTPRDTTAWNDTIDVRIDAMMDKLIDAEFEFGITQKSNAQVGPNARATISKRNAFGHGETLSVGLKGSYEWQTGHRTYTNTSRPDSWEAGLDASLSYPWLAFPFSMFNQHFLTKTLRIDQQSTVLSSQFKFSIDNLKRAGYYRLVSVGAEATYNFQTSRYVTHQFTPLSITYNRLMNTSEKFDSIVANNSSLALSMRNQLVPAMQYVFTYDNNSNANLRRTTRFVLTLKEAGNILNGIYSAAGEGYNTKDKRLLGAPFSQFFKVHAELANRFYLTDKSLIATRLQCGAIFNYGNSTFAPYSELFYAGGANSVRGFAVRTIGPGAYYDTSGRGTWLDQSGDFKLEANVEYRFPLISNLYGALFVDAGNVWLLESDDAHPGGKITEQPFLKTIATSTGFGLRYDMEFLVLRLDLGIGIHAPYDTGKDSYYNMRKFKDSLGLHFAVGYPF